MEVGQWPANDCKMHGLFFRVVMFSLPEKDVTMTTTCRQSNAQLAVKRKMGGLPQIPSLLPAGGHCRTCHSTHDFAFRENSN